VQAAVSRACALLGLPEGLEFARGASALYALLRAVAERDGEGEVIVPSICCETVALAALYAGHEVRFADVSRDSLCLTPQSVTPLMSARTRAVLVVHAYGADAGAAGFMPLRAAHPGVVFVEDIAQAIGGRDSGGRLLGAGLDCALLSFARDKIVAGDGGALLFPATTRCPSVEAIRISAPSGAVRLPQPLLAKELRDHAHAFGDRWRLTPESPTAPGLAASADRFRDLIVCAGGIANDALAVAGLDRLEVNRGRRYARYLEYRAGISRPRVRFAGAPHQEGMCWRASILFDAPADARKVTFALRSASIHASNHYVPLHLLFGGPPLPDSEFVGARIVNLWVDENAPDEMIRSAIDIINRSC
jgi:dTDP-4-amino-4,6-dideoxygalactose transaminase